MKRSVVTSISIISIITMVFGGNVFPEGSPQAGIRKLSKDINNCSLSKEENDGSYQENFSIDFSDYFEGSVKRWLASKGFCFNGGIRDNRIIELSANKQALSVRTKQPGRVFIFNNSVDLKEFSKVKIEWGIIQYPKDASYEKNINNEALMVYIFFGNVKLPSGCFLVPDSPYFIGLFLSKEDQINKPYTGRYFKEGGRFVCLGNPEPRDTVISEFDLNRAFRLYFNDAVPPISGISLEVDTSSSKDEGKAEAFIKRIEFLGR
ncbi:hypothetical protein BIY37_01695 [Candidatus Brocadia sapporoensis]|uniref:Uncharacterized protein n=1 Tax=Candidatus Brocadia sapporoensis TaxID=392547 RepID=A0A1V6M2Z3_9BACT|nr:hypothetical protein [Candidatus Brocadia sapporoensis]MDG6006501.1 hypothetical protein [Candidatus Brocadia sp.]OQD46747.1 hypothetical protein BIY37_01695 [Candidatus Brocadia sapporoensis]GJQ22653.1 MAG: hypothetical protein HBSAPP01_04430 [Candidatus Brocadia sapporoensis]